MQSIAAENNLAETAFVVKEPEGYRIRWFTPTCEVNLCGHATLAAAYAMFTYEGETGSEIRFASKSGELGVSRQGDRFCLDFPARPPARCEPSERVIEGLGTQPLEIQKADYYLVIYGNEEEVAGIRPDFRALALVPTGIIVTAPGREVDFVSRFFAPSMGIDEDPVTGSAHCTLTPYWSRRLGRKRLHARQISPRGGELWLEDRGERVLMAGHAAAYLRGVIEAG
jgi:PhzF family phenazine biosynthesis protein